MINTLSGYGPNTTRAVRLASQAATGSTAPRPPTHDGAAETVPGPEWLQFVPAGVRRLVQSHVPDWLQFVPPEVRGLVQSPVPEGMRDFIGQVSGGYALPDSALAHPFPAPAGVAVPEGARFLSGTFSNQAGIRPYKLYVPSGYTGQPVPLIVMLHGCTQSPDDFAAGTGMNAAAEEQTCLVVYPGQPASAHAQKCWKWFSADDQQRDKGEPSLIAGITRQVMQDYAVDPQRVYVAGLSAGGAAAAVMGDTYPDLYAAIGVHSGLACGAARDLPSGVAAMQRGSGAVAHSRQHAGVQRRIVPAIVFHGDRDTTVSPRNCDDVVAQSVQDATLRKQVQNGQVPGGHAFSRTVYSDEAGQPITEQWVIHGAGHAWSGGKAAGSYTDPHGPDATLEMLRFFREHPHPAPTQTA
jgi:poly(hydroxyalkanoate) depolymerase family esterase